MAQAQGFEGAQLHYAFVTFDNAERFAQLLSSGDRAGAAAIYPLPAVGLTALAGPLTTLLLIAIATVVIVRRRAGLALTAFCAGLALTAGLRAWVGIYYILMVRPKFPDARPNFDEINAARAFDIPVDWIVWPATLVTAVCAITAMVYLKPHRWLKVAGAIAASVLAIFVWATIGRFILP